MNKEKLKYVLRESEDLPLPSIRPRAIRLPIDSGKVIVLVGIRRSGKTFILLDLIRRLTSAGVDRRRIVQLSFEDDRLHPMRAADLDLILQAHTELHPDQAREPRYFLFDEVQNAPGWERFVRRLHDTRAGTVFLTGSSSKLLSREIATGLRGRCLSYEVFPLSFGEYLDFIGLRHEAYSADSEISPRADSLRGEANRRRQRKCGSWRDVRWLPGEVVGWSGDQVKNNQTWRSLCMSF